MAWIAITKSLGLRKFFLIRPIAQVITELFQGPGAINIAAVSSVSIRHKGHVLQRPPIRSLSIEFWVASDREINLIQPSMHLTPVISRHQHIFNQFSMRLHYASQFTIPQ